MTERQGGEQTGWKRTALTSYRGVGNFPVQKGRKKLLINCYLVAKSCLTPSDPMDWSSPGSSVHGIPQQESWSGLPFPSPRDLCDPGIELASPALAGRFFTTAPPGKPNGSYSLTKCMLKNKTWKSKLPPWYKRCMMEVVLADTRTWISLSISIRALGWPGACQ